MEYNFFNNIPVKQKLIMKSLIEFYNTENININIIIPILSGNTKLSLRIIDWFVTNYSKKNNIRYDLEKTKNGKKIMEQFVVHLNYKNQLKAYTKKSFDPFCRRDRIQFPYNNDNFLITTVGQLNFFKWALETKIIDYINENINDIDTDMNKNIKTHNKSKTIDKTNKINGSESSIKSERRKRRELSVSATKTLNKHKYNITLDFN
jgi:hypothetical protein